MKTSSLTLIAFLLLLCSCGGASSKSAETGSEIIYKPTYASGFTIKRVGEHSSVIESANPWQGAHGVTTRLLVLRDGDAVPQGYDGQILRGDAKRIACMSSSHVAMLDATGDASKIVAVSGRDAVTNPAIARNRDKIAEIGYESQLNYELLLSLKPDIVLLYGIDSASPAEAKLKELGIPFMYIGEYVEPSPLGKAEWLVATAEITGHREQGINHFKQIPERYEALKKVAASAENHPKVMVNTPYADSWVMPSTQNYVALLIADAAGDYAFKENTSNRSVPIDIEKAYMLANSSDVWINVGQNNTLAQLTGSFPKFADVKPVREHRVYNPSLRTNEFGGSDYWESGVVNPDLVLADLIKIFHPELLQNRPFTYYKRLD